MKVWLFQSYRLCNFSAIKKTVTGVEGCGKTFLYIFKVFFYAVNE